MAGVPGTASAIFGAVKDVEANVIMIYGTASAVFCFKPISECNYYLWYN